MKYDFIVIGGGFFGLCLALTLRSLSQRVLILEAGDAVMTQASQNNQARIHSGFHYPRSFMTATSSARLYKRFVADFPEAVFDDFQMIYAIAKRNSKVNVNRFQTMFEMMDAPIEPVRAAYKHLFDPKYIADAFECYEPAFDYSILKKGLLARLDAAGVDVVFGHEVERVEQTTTGLTLHCANNARFDTHAAFNVTYAQINTVLKNSDMDLLPLKHEHTEICLVEPPTALKHLGFTVMDGPFFSMMPYPARGRHSLTHVRYTPHQNWVDEKDGSSPYEIYKTLPKASRWRHMVSDAAKYLPSIRDVTYDSSMFVVKTVMTKNERDDGRPIVFHQHTKGPHFFSVMGGKIDNIYDLFAVLPNANPAWRGLNLSYLLPA